MSCTLAYGPAAEAAQQSCTLRQSDGVRIALRLDARDSVLTSFSMAFTQATGVSAHECSLSARRGDGRSRWREGRGATYVTLNDRDLGRLEAVAQPYRGDWQLSVSAAEGEPASCGAFIIPATVIVTPEVGGRCVATLPRRRVTLR
ncbi:hypothetical protein [uncultured Sphingomonas sp.]|uniref:hypothetical protein n=1 Tax=uncultured Sphingomonas sp. TaxID=158754 RepID=UPI0035CBE63C